jgi:hypothetical protein
MTFPDGRIKDGLFENNVFKGQTTQQSNTTMSVNGTQDDFLNTSIN